MGVICIVLYLSSIFALHITIPALLNFVPANGSTIIYLPTKLSNTSTDITLWVQIFSASVHSKFWLLDSLSESYDILSTYDKFPKLGLQDSMVYDIIPTVPSAIGIVRVNASIYTVDCSAASPANLTRIYGYNSPDAKLNTPSAFQYQMSLGLLGNVSTQAPSA